MRTIVVLFALLGQTPQLHAPRDFQSWTPPPDQVAKIEAQVSHALPDPLSLAQRRYHGSIETGRHRIIAQYYWGEHVQPGLIIEKSASGEFIADGGCSVFNISYDADNDQVEQAKCGGR